MTGDVTGAGAVEECAEDDAEGEADACVGAVADGEDPDEEAALDAVAVEGDV